MNQFYHYVLSHFLEKHHRVKITSENVVSLLFIIYYSQLICLTQQNGSEVYSKPLEINLLNAFYYYGKIWRPYNFLLGFQSFRLYACAIPIIILLLVSIDFILQWLNEIRQRKNQSKIQNKKVRIQSEKLLSIIFQIHLYTISLYEIDLFLISIKEAISQFPNNLEVLCLSVFFLICKILFILLSLICSESMHFPSSPLHFNILSSSQFINIFLIILSFYLNHIEYDWNENIIHAINLVIIGIYIYQEIQKKSSYLQMICLLILTYGFFYNLSYYFVIQATFKEYQIGLLYVLCPLFLNLVILYSKINAQINFSKNRNLEQIFKNLLILYHVKQQKQQNAFEMAILKQLNKDDDPFQSEFHLFNNKILKSKKSKKEFWYYKYIVIKLALLQLTDTLILIHNFREQMLFSEISQQFKKVQGKMSFIQNLKLINLREEVYSLLNYNITKYCDNDKLNANKYVSYKISLQKLQNDLSNLFIKKQSLHQKILENKPLQDNLLYNLSYSLVKESLNVQDNLKQELNNLKTFRIQQLLTILNVEFFNNVLKAELLKYYQLSNEEFKLVPIENMEFIHLRLEDNLMNSQILYISQKLLNQIGYKFQDYQKHSLKMLFSDSFYEQHQKLIKEFLQNVQCKFLNKAGEIVLRGNNNVYFQAQFQLNIENTTLPQLCFYAFIKISEEQSISVYVSNNFQIIGYTQPFQKILITFDVQQKQLYLSDVRKLISFDQTQQFGKSMEVFFYFRQDKIYNMTIHQKRGFLEYLLQEEKFELSLFQEQKTNPKSLNPSLELNEESIVVVPKILSFEDLNSPLSIGPKGTNQELLQNEIKKDQTVKSAGESNFISEPLHVERNVSIQDTRKKDREEQNNDQASSKFSRGILDNSIFYGKYNKLNLFLNQNSKTSQIYIALFFFLVAFLTNIIFQIINSLSFLPQLQRMILDTDLLALKGGMMAPIHNCVTAQASVVDYMILAYITKDITEEHAYTKMQFAYDSIEKSYLNLKDSIILQINDENLQEFFYDKYISIQQFENTTLVNRDILIKTCLINYLQSQYYITIQDYYHVFSIIATNDFVFYMANLKVLDDYMDELSDEIETYILNRVLIFQSDQTKFFLKMLFLEVLVLSLGLAFLLKNQYTLSYQFKLFTDINVYAINKEISKEQKIIQILSHDDAFQIYNFEVAEFEQDIQKQSYIYNLKINQNRLANHHYQPPRLLIFGIFVFLIALYIIPSIILSNQNNSYFEKYMNSAGLLIKLSKVCSAVTAIYQMREVNYMINGNSPFFDFFTDEKRLEQNEKILAELEKIQDFLSSYILFDYDSLLIDDDFVEKFENVQSQNLCNFVSHYNTTLAEIHCELIYDGVMKLGLINTLNEIYEQISTEYENTNGFEIKLRNKAAAYEEVEIGLIASEAIYYLYSEILEGIQGQTIYLVDIHQAFVGVYISISLIFAIILLSLFQPYIENKALITRNMILLIPRLQFYLDYQFETDFRLLQIQNQ